MKKNMYYRTVLQRRNFIKEFFFNVFFLLSGLWRIYIENIIRRNMGERYFSYFLSVLVAISLVLTPLITCRVFGLFISYETVDFEQLFKKYTTWYVYTWFFIQCTRKRLQEIKREPSVFDFKRFSLSSGTLEEFYVPFIPKALLFDPRKCDIFGEPLPFFLVGILLSILGQPLGFLFISSSIVYCFSYMAAYYNGDNFVMDKIDEIILNEEMESAFIGDSPVTETRGVQFILRKPTSEELRRKVAVAFFEDDSPKEPTLMR